jgi:hypothetical protein
VGDSAAETTALPILLVGTTLPNSTKTVNNPRVVGGILLPSATETFERADYDRRKTAHNGGYGGAGVSGFSEIY